MECIACKRPIGRKLKKNELYNCQCGAKLLAVEINKELIVMDLKNNKGENNA